MAGEFGQFKPAERQLSDVTSVQAPVQDTSSATAMSAIAQGISSLGQAAMTAFKIDDQQKQAQLKMDQEAALMEQKRDFEKELLRAKDIADQHGSTSLGFKTFLTMAYDQSNLDPDTKSKMLRDFQGTVLGKSFTELSPEEKGFRKLREEAASAGFFNENSTEEEVEKGLLEFSVAQRQAKADSAELSRINLARAKLGLTRDQQTQIDSEISRKQFNTMANLAANYRTPVKNAIDSIITSLNKGEITSKEAQEILVSKKGALQATVAQMTREVQDKGSVDSLSQPLFDLYDYAINNVDSEDVLEQLKVQNQLMIEKTKFAQLTGDPELVRLIGLSSLVGHNNPTLIASLSPKTAETIKNNGRVRGKPVDITAEDNKAYLDLMAYNIDRVGVLKPNGEPEVRPQELLVQINNTLLGANRYIDPEDPPTQNKQILQWLAQPRVGEYVKDNLGQLTPEARVKLTDTLINNAVNYVYPRAQELTNSLFVEERDPRFKTSKVKKVGGVTEDEVEMVAQGNSVVFRGTSPESQRVADTMNREIAGALTTYFNATANVSADSFTSVFEREKQVVWPSKYGEPTEDGVFVDTETGEEFEVRDGKRVKLGSSRIEREESLSPTGDVTKEGRPVYKNQYGDFVTERTITEEIPELGGVYNVPTVFDGRFLSPDEAINKVIEAGGKDPITGRDLERFSNIEDAVDSARKRSNSLMGED